MLDPSKNCCRLNHPPATFGLLLCRALTRHIQTAKAYYLVGSEHLLNLKILELNPSRIDVPWQQRVRCHIPRFHLKIVQQQQLI